MSDLAARNGGRVGLAALVAVLLLGLALRVDYAWEGRAPVYDAVAYERIAENLADGEGFTLGPGATQPASNYSPGLPLLVGGVYAVAGGDERLARLVLALIGSLAVLFAYLLGRRLALSARLTRERSLAPLAGLVGAACVAIYPALLEYQGMPMGEPLAATLLSGGMLAALWAGSSSPPLPPRHPREWRWLIAGLAFGALVLVRPEYLAIVVLLAAVVLVRMRQDWKVGLAQAAALLLGALLIVAPWTGRNLAALDRFVPVSTGGGQVLFAGTYMPSGGDPQRVGRELLERHPELTAELAAIHLSRSSLSHHGGRKGERAADAGGDDELVEAVLAEVRLEQILAAHAARIYPRMETDEALARIGRERLRDAVTGEPLAYAGFVAAKAWRIWGHGPRAVMEKPGWRLFHWALVALGALGLGLLAWRRRWEALPLAVVLLSTLLIGLLLVASPRRVLVAIPLLAALAGVATAWLSTRIRP